MNKNEANLLLTNNKTTQIIANNIFLLEFEIINIHVLAISHENKKYC
jgi:hypothetical protein